MSDENERSVASDGSVSEPVAYQAVDEYGRPFGYAQIILPFGKWPKSQRVALYRQPQPALTDAEREAVRFAATAALPETEKLGGVTGELCRMHAATLRGLLARQSYVKNDENRGLSNTSGAINE